MRLSFPWWRYITTTRRRYEKGKYLKKENTWKDFTACAQHLISKNIAHPDLYDWRRRVGELRAD